jgi:hypothetical protein
MPLTGRDQPGVEISMKSGVAEGLPYSLSRWTDVPSAKWPWFKQQLEQGYMVGFDPRTGIPAQWSLDGSAVHGLIFWTKNPTNLLNDAKLIREYPLVIHVTLTGWTEVEKGAPGIAEGIGLLRETIKTFGAKRVVWRFSPIPQLSNFEVLERFMLIAPEVMDAGLFRCYAAFLQGNDLMPETRTPARRRLLLAMLATATQSFNPDFELMLCQDDKETLASLISYAPVNLKLGVCEDGKIFGGAPPVMDCGCCLSVDPFTVNESCTMGCAYCYAADRSLAPKKRNTTSLRVLR